MQMNTETWLVFHPASSNQRHLALNNNAEAAPRDSGGPHTQGKSATLRTEGSSTVLRTAFICVFCALTALAQTSSDDPRRLPQRRFPPEISQVRRDSSVLKPTGAYCVDSSFERRSVKFRRCAKGSYIRLVQPIKPPWSSDRKFNLLPIAQ